MILCAVIQCPVLNLPMFQGCYYTGNYSGDLAAAWIIENQDRNLDGPLEVSILVH